MNYTLIILGVILLVVIYILYKVISEKGKLVSSKIDLSAANGSIGYSTLTNPKSSRFCFSLWVYMEALNPTGNTKVFSIDKSSTKFFELKFNNQSTLYYDILLDNNSTATNEIMVNYPLQKWVCVMVSVDNKVVDLYIDGKLIRSQQLDNLPASTDSDHNVTYGDCNSNSCKGYIAKFERLSKPMDPATAWSKYMDGNGGNYFSKLLSSYGASFTLTKDDLDLRQFTLF